MHISPYNEDRWKVTFPYNLGWVTVMQQCPDRRFLKSEKAWTVPKCLPVFGTLYAHLSEIHYEVYNDVQELLKIQQGSSQFDRIEIPATYTYKTTPFSFQPEDIEYVLNKKACGVFNEMGTGKSKVVIDACSILYHLGQLRAVLLVCPNTVKGSWSDPSTGQIATHCPVDHTVLTVQSGKLKKAAQLQGEGLVFVVINYEALRTEKIKKILVPWVKQHQPWIILDESTAIKNDRSLQSKACQELGKLVERRTIMTGTPIANNPGDFYGQFKFLDPRILQYPTFGSFKARYAVTHTLPNHAQIVLRWQHLDELDERMCAYYTRRLKKDCLDLPEKVYLQEEVALSKEQSTAYTELKKELYTMVKHQEISVTNALVKLLRLQQITAGFLMDDEGQRVPLPSPKITQAVERVNDLQKPTIIFCKFLDEIEQLLLQLPEAQAIYGDIPPERRTEIINAFQGGRLSTVICQIDTGGIGITLSRAEYVLYLTNSFSHKDRMQSEDRAHRAGITHHVTYIDFLATLNGTHTVDHLVRGVLKGKKNVSDLILDHIDEI